MQMRPPPAPRPNPCLLKLLQRRLARNPNPFLSQALAWEPQPPASRTKFDPPLLFFFEFSLIGSALDNHVRCNQTKGEPNAQKPRHSSGLLSMVLPRRASPATGEQETVFLKRNAPPAQMFLVLVNRAWKQKMKRFNKRSLNWAGAGACIGLARSDCRKLQCPWGAFANHALWWLKAAKPQDGTHEPECKHVRKTTYVQVTLL